MVHILDIFVSIAMSTILFLAGCSDKAEWTILFG